MNFSKIFTLILGVSSLGVYSQVGINTTSPQSSSILHIVGPNKTILIPKVADPTIFDGKTQLKGGLFFDDQSVEKCPNVMEADGSRSTCLLTLSDLATSAKYENSFSTTTNLSALTYTQLLSVSIPSASAPRRLFVSFDMTKNISVSVLGNCAATDLEIRLTNTATSTTTVLYSGQTYLAPRKILSTDIYPFSEMSYLSLDRNQAYTVSVFYKKSTACLPLVDQALEGNLLVTTY